MKLIYQNPAHAWTEALPIGNGRLGAMVTGMCNSANIYMDLMPYIDSVLSVAFCAHGHFS